MEVVVTVERGLVMEVVVTGVGLVMEVVTVELAIVGVSDGGGNSRTSSSGG